MDNNLKQISVAVAGGGISGSTCAIMLAEQGIQVTLFEKGPSLVNGPPICHLHAGGNLYREISEHQCLNLLRQSIETVRLYPQSMNVRPTIIAVPVSDAGDPLALLPRLKLIQSAYQQLVEDDPSNHVLGFPEEYYRLVTKDELIKLKDKQQSSALTQNDWLIPFAKHTDLEQLKFPIVVVQEFGLSVFRMAAMASLATDSLEHCHVNLNTELVGVEPLDSKWQVSYQQENGKVKSEVFDYLINASGFETGTIDDMAKKRRQRFVEFKAAYVTRWRECDEQWPEVIFHGERGTPKGMAQLTPYADGYFQLHGMTEEITLFKGGLASSAERSAQPILPDVLKRKIRNGWQAEIQYSRTSNAIAHMSTFVPSFHTAEFGGKPLFGAQQIPGKDPSLRAADVTFEEDNYARIEIVKASSAIDAGRKILKQFFDIEKEMGTSIESQHASLALQPSQTVEQLAEQLAEQRQYPIALAKIAGKQ